VFVSQPVASLGGYEHDEVPLSRRSRRPDDGSQPRACPDRTADHAKRSGQASPCLTGPCHFSSCHASSCPSGSSAASGTCCPGPPGHGPARCTRSSPCSSPCSSTPGHGPARRPRSSSCRSTPGRCRACRCRKARQHQHGLRGRARHAEGHRPGPRQEDHGRACQGPFPELRRSGAAQCAALQRRGRPARQDQLLIAPACKILPRSGKAPAGRLLPGLFPVRYPAAWPFAVSRFGIDTGSAPPHSTGA